MKQEQTRCDQNRRSLWQRRRARAQTSRGEHVTGLGRGQIESRAAGHTRGRVHKTGGYAHSENELGRIKRRKSLQILIKKSLSLRLYLPHNNWSMWLRRPGSMPGSHCTPDN